MNVLEKAMSQARGVTNSYRESLSTLREKGGSFSGLMDPGFGGGVFSRMQDQAKYKERYAMFTGTLYAAVNALAEAAASQPVNVGKMPGKEEEEDKKKPGKTKFSVLKSMTKSARTKAEVTEVELLDDHNLNTALENPNPAQSKWEFVYSFIANLCLTGWSYIVADVKEDGTPELWSIPTTWVKPDHREGPFSKFKIGNPSKPGEMEEFSREQVGFAHIPNPADPLSALSPAGSQSVSIRIADHIETSRDNFFHNGIFPSVIVTVGKNPHPDVAAQTRPRLSAGQRRQIYSAIGKTMAGVANYGNPAIIDGLIERIDRLSMTQNEMGWEKSEKAVDAKILSAFCVHPFILGREMSIGGWSQATIIRQLFYDRVNIYLDFLSNVITNLIGGGRQDNTLIIWWEELEAVDPTQRNAMVRFARQQNDITTDELRSMLGLGPDEDRNEQHIDKSALQGITALLGKIGQGVDTDQAVAVFEGMGLPSDLAKKMAGPKREAQPPQAPPTAPGVPPGSPAQNQEEQQQEGQEEPPTAQEAVKMLKSTMDELRKNDLGSANRIASWVVDLASSKHLQGQHNQSSHGRGGGGGGGDYGSSQEDTYDRATEVQHPTKQNFLEMMAEPGPVIDQPTVMEYAIDRERSGGKGHWDKFKSQQEVMDDFNEYRYERATQNSHPKKNDFLETMAETGPVIDNPGVMEFVIHRERGKAGAKVWDKYKDEDDIKDDYDRWEGDYGY